jgi:MFS family permease
VIRQHGQGGDAVVAAAVIVSQLLAAAMSSPMGRMADNWGRRAVLLLGLLALPVKAGLFALGGPSELTVVYQAFDAVSAASLGLIVPLLVADITRKQGHFNLAMGFIGLASGIGGAGGTALAGVAADWFGGPQAFMSLAAIGLIAAALARAMLPGPAPVSRS